LRSPADQTNWIRQQAIRENQTKPIDFDPRKKVIEKRKKVKAGCLDLIIIA